jgi:hypothetical protein
MIFAKFSDISGNDVYVRRDEVIAVTTSADVTCLWLRQDENPIRVVQSPAEAVRVLCDE